MFKLEYGDALFKLFAPDGTFTSAVHYYNFATIEYNGKVYGAYLTGDEEEEDITVYDLSEFPKLTPVPTEAEEVEFDGENDGLQEVACEKCDGDGFYFEPIAGFVKQIEAPEGV